MGAPTAYYVDYDAGDDGTGNGSSGTPWKTLYYALDNSGSPGITRDGTNGDVVYVKNNGSQVLTATLDVTQYGSPVANAPLAIVGYGSTINDMTKATIDGNGSYGLDATGEGYVTLANIILTNSGSTQLLNTNFLCNCYNCEFSSTSNNPGVRVSTGNVVRCKFSSMTGAVAAVISGGCVYQCFFDGTDSNTTNLLQSAATAVIGNVFKGGASFGLLYSNVANPLIAGNLFWCRSSITASDHGMYSGNNYAGMAINNYFENADDCFGDVASKFYSVIHDNYEYNITAEFSNTPEFYVGNGILNTLTASVLETPGSGDFNINNTSGGGQTLRGLTYDIN